MRKENFQPRHKHSLMLRQQHQYNILLHVLYRYKLSNTTVDDNVVLSFTNCGITDKKNREKLYDKWTERINEHIDGFVQLRRNSIANALELRLSCTNPSNYVGWAHG